MKLIIDIPDMIYNILNSNSSWNGLSVDYILNAVKDGTPLEAQSTYKCKGCYYNDGETHAECVVCDKKAQPTDEIKEAYLKGYDYGVKDWFKSKTQPCEDAVSREAVIENVIKCTDMNEDTMEVLENKVKALPSVYPERPKGKWNFIGYQMFECSSCKIPYTQNQFEELRLYTTDDLLPKYCPNCGAEMSGGGEDEVSD